MEKIVLNAYDIAHILEIGLNSAYNLMHREGFPALRVGKKWLVPREAFMRWLNEQAGKEAR